MFRVEVVSSELEEWGSDVSPQQQFDDPEASTTIDATTGEQDVPTSFPYGDTDISPDPLAAPTPGAAACPDCDGETINGQGVLDCRECDWTGAR